MDHVLEAWGPYGCFTRPDFGTERVSYPVITPSAARALFEAVYWKPQMAWQVTRIEVLRMGRTMPLRTNEVKARAGANPIFVSEHRIQRHSLILADIAYRLHAEIVFLGGEAPGPKHTEMFRRRLERGQVHHRPYFGCREFACEVGPPTDREPERISLDLGTMLLDRDWEGLGDPPRFFHARIADGTIMVPARPLRQAGAA